MYVCMYVCTYMHVVVAKNEIRGSSPYSSLFRPGTGTGVYRFNGCLPQLLLLSNILLIAVMASVEAVEGF